MQRACPAQSGMPEQWFHEREGGEGSQEGRPSHGKADAGTANASTREVEGRCVCVGVPLLLLVRQRQVAQDAARARGVSENARRCCLAQHGARRARSVRRRYAVGAARAQRAAKRRA